MSYITYLNNTYGCFYEGMVVGWVGLDHGCPIPILFSLYSDSETGQVSGKLKIFYQS